MVLLRQNRRIAGLAALFGAAALTRSGSNSIARADETTSKTEAGAQNAMVESVELSEAPLGLAINLIRQKTGINVAIKNGNASYGKVTLSIRRKPISDVLKLMAESAGADFWEENGVFWFGPKGSAPKPDAANDPTLPTADTVPLRDPSDTVWEKIRLVNTSPHRMMTMLGLNGGTVGTFEDQFTATVMRKLLNVDANPYHEATANNGLTVLPGYNGYSSPTAPRNNNSANSNSSAPNVIPNTPTGNLPASGTNNASDNTDQNAQRDSDGFAEFGRGGGQFGGQPGGAGGAGGRGGATGGQGVGLLPDGIPAGDLYAMDADGSILVRHPKSDVRGYRQLRELISLLDVKPQQIMIKAEFVTVNQNDLSGFGINWNFQKVNLVAGTSLGQIANPTAFIQYAAGNLQTTLTWVLTTGRGKVVSAPMATTLNNVPVTFTNTVTTPVLQSQTTLTNGGAAAVSQIPVGIQTTKGLSVLPRINGDDTITLFGTVFFSDVTGTIVGANGDTFPIILQQTAPVQRIIRNGDTMVIGGLTSKSTVVSTARTPLLGDLPILGTLFRSRTTTVNDSDLLVFITAAIIPERPTSNSLPGGGASGGIPGIPGGPGGAGGGTTP